MNLKSHQKSTNCYELNISGFFITCGDLCCIKQNGQRNNMEKGKMAEHIKLQL